MASTARMLSRSFRCLSRTQTQRYHRAFTSGYPSGKHVNVLRQHYIHGNPLAVHSRRRFSSNDEFGDIKDIDPIQVDAARNGKGDNLKYLIIDVREAGELQKDGDLGEDNTDWVNIPLGDIRNLSDKEELSELLWYKGIEDMDDYQDFYFLCKIGVRSHHAAKHILELDVDQTLFNITGGIVRYRDDVGL